MKITTAEDKNILETALRLHIKFQEDCLDGDINEIARGAIQGRIVSAKILLRKLSREKVTQ